MINRRTFLGGLSASLAARTALGKVADAADAPLLRLGIVSDTHCRQSFDPSDRKTWGHWSTYVLEKTLEKFRDWGVDAVVHPGDFTEYGAIAELEATGISWRRVFPNHKGKDGKIVERLFVRGNHDKMGKEEDLDQLIRKDPAKTWKDVFDVDWYTEKVMLRRVNGYVFVLSDWETTRADLDAFFASHAKDIPSKQPFFYVQHAPPAGTVDCAQDAFGDRCGGDNCACARWLRKYPNCIALTGHSHYSVTLGDQTWHEDFLSIGCGCLQYMWNRKGRDNSWSLPKGVKGHARRCSSSGRQGMYMRVYADRIVLERWDFVNMEKVGPDRVFPLDGTKPFSYAEQRKRARAPEFPKGAELAFAGADFHYRVQGEKWFDERQLQVAVPRAAECAFDEGRVYEYECKVFDPAAGKEPLLVRRELAEGYFLNDARVEKTTTVAFGVDELPPGRELVFEVCPLDCWENRGKPLTGRFTVGKVKKNG